MDIKFKYAIIFSASDEADVHDAAIYFDKIGYNSHLDSHNGILVAPDKTPVEIVIEFQKYMETKEKTHEILSARLIRFYDEGDLLNAKLDYTINNS
ncbi:hypothetical protein [Vibrio metschnikovii]|uniref:Uncharacterized protein n=1 Tax=Vibrio metschnikovii TaxID=28172 RepID=A0A9X0R7Y8_VIBME|nr:hypothetical protein [Vibrio metschnikovii]MBC5851399.1 hypothetical protein [Vibrio metschnikovii]